MRLPAPLALLVAAGLLLLAAPSAVAAIAYTPCGARNALQCGSLDVPLDRSGVLPGAVKLVVARRVAPSNPTNTAVLGLAGGPGQAAVPLIYDFAELLGSALGTRDLLMFDQRGTGSSGRLHCTFDGPITRIGARCAGQLGPGRGSYTTAASVEDIEAVRAASGYDKLVLFGVSYGTKVALDYAARYPDHVSGLILDSVVLPSGEDPLQRSTFIAMRRVLTQLCAGNECDGITHNPVGDLAGRVRSLARKPLIGPLTSDRGVRQRLAVNRLDLFNVMLSGDTNPTLRAELPGALTSARKGDSAPLVRLVARSDGIISLRRQAADSDFSDATFLATLCEETNFPWDRAASFSTRAQQINAAARAAGEAAFSPFDSATALTSQTVTLCLGWPSTTTAGFTPAGPLPNVPTLVIGGNTDVRTPLEDATLVRALIPSAQILAIPFTGHSALGSDLSDEQCATRGVAQFFAGQPVTPCAPELNPFSPTPVAPTKFSRLEPTGRGGKIGRTITAALATAQDMRRQVLGDAFAAGQLPSRAGGLRGGRIIVRNEVLTLFKVVYVPGVKVSGTVPLNAGGRQRLTLSGTRASKGKITVTPTTITGRLGGRKISLVARSAAAAPGGLDVDYRRLLRRFALRNVR
jgi:pimeloyl-ACP methyl ester carboxylesterase